MTKQSLRVLKIALILLVILSSIMLIWGMTRMGSGTLVFINAGVQLLLILIGGFLVVREDWPKKHSYLTIGALALVGSIGMFAAIRQGQESSKETAEAQRRLAESNAKLNATLDDISRVQGLNTELQRKLMDSSGKILDQGETISDLSKQAIDTTTGGKSFCSLMFITRDKALVPVIEHQGKEPLYDVVVRIINLQEFHGESKGETSRSLEVGNLSPNSAFYAWDKKIPLDESLQRMDFKVIFLARNGWWTQELLMRKVSSGYWSEATRIYRKFWMDLTPPPETERIFYKVGTDFPTREPDWFQPKRPPLPRDDLDRFVRK